MGPNPGLQDYIVGMFILLSNVASAIFFNSRDLETAIWSVGFSPFQLLKMIQQEDYSWFPVMSLCFSLFSVAWLMTQYIDSKENLSWQKKVFHTLLWMSDSMGRCAP